MKPKSEVNKRWKIVCYSRISKC